MAEITRADILGAINSVTGDPSTGVVHDATPAIVEAIARLVEGDVDIEQRVVKPAETRKVSVSD